MEALSLSLLVLSFLSSLAPASAGGARRRPLSAPRARESCEHSPTSRGCWGEYSIDTDWDVEWPTTGVVREYWLTVDKVRLAPDGYEREVLAFNGTIPGPTIRADWGDDLVIHVTNNLPQNGTSVHWHGIRQLNSNAQDGVPGVTQCPIAPGETKTYRFQATQYGSSWYHSHYSLQLADGLAGPLVIDGPASADYDVDAGPLLIQEHFHESVDVLWEKYQKKLALVQPAAENGLINGMNTFDCSSDGNGNDPAACVGGGRRFETEVERGKRYRFRVVGVQADGWMKLTIDGHKLTVIAADFVPVRPYQTDAVLLGSGQRYDVLVDADQPGGEGAYWIRAIYQTACNLNNNDNKDNILGILRYAGGGDDDDSEDRDSDSDENEDPTTTVSPSVTNSCGDEPYASLVPWVARDVGVASSRELIGLLAVWQPDTVFHWLLRTKHLDVDWSRPTIRDVYNNNNETTSLLFPPESNVAVVDAVDRWVYWVIQDQSPILAFHPMHLHGHDFYVLAQGAGPYVPGLVQLNTRNPPRRDTAALIGAGYTVIAFKTDNPGSWLFHCHIAWHASQGLALQLLERQADIPSVIEGDMDELEETCGTWQQYWAEEKPPKDDSGI